MPILSPARVTAIIEQTAAKHQIDVRVMLCAAWRRDMMLARGEVAYRLRNELKLSFALIAERLGTVPSRAHSLFTEYSKRLEQARRLLPAADLAALALIEGDAVRRRALEAEERAAALEADLARLTGSEVALVLSEALEIGGKHRGPFGAVLMLSILVSNYPNCVLGQHLIELYDEGSARLGWGRANGASHVLMAKNASNISKIFRARGWIEPIEMGDLARSRRLTDGAAEFLNARAGYPRWVQGASRTKARSAPVRSVAA